MVGKAVEIFSSTTEGCGESNGAGAVTCNYKCLTGAIGYVHQWGDVRYAVE